LEQGRKTHTQIKGIDMLRLLIFVLIYSIAANQSVSAIAANKPNVLFISIDDLNDWIGCLGGHPQAKTPNIDKLAKRGTLFTRAYCPAPACLPSRAATLTGVAPFRSGCYVNSPTQTWQDILLPIAVPLPAHFRANGYEAAGAGKIYHHYQNHPDSWDDYWPSKNLQFPPTHRPTKNNLPTFELMPRSKNWYTAFNWGPLDKTVEQTGDWMSMKFVSQKLNEKRDKPFFLACGIYRPHVPWFVPRKFFDMFPLENIQLPPSKTDDYSDIPKGAPRRGPCIYYKVLDANKYHQQAVQAYLASVAYTDELVGRLLKNLDDSGHADNTIIVFWSDHGWHLGEKLTYRKFTLWEEACRVPMIIALPETLKQNFRQGINCARPVNLLDLYPTLLELCDIKPPRQHMDGRSLVPLLKHPKADWPHGSITSNGFRNDSLRTQRWRFTRYANGSLELYDHVKDPYEWKNLAGDNTYAETVKTLLEKLPQKHVPLAKTKPFDFQGFSRKYYKEFREKKLIERIKRD
jgi:arylsulfatase A-like enzyme